MADKKTFTGATVDEAITEAALSLGVPSSDLEYSVIDGGSKGFLGLFARRTIIEAWPKEKAGEDLSEEKPRQKKQDRPEQDERRDGRKKNDQPKKLENKNEQAPEKKKEPEKKEPVKKEQKQEPKKQANNQQNSQKPQQGKKQEQKPEDKPRKEAAVMKTEAAPEKAAAPKPEKVKTTENDKAHFEEGKQFLIDVFAKMGMKVEIEYTYDAADNALSMTLSGDEMGVLIGKRGQTLDSLQYLTSLVVNRTGEHYIRVKLDTENYRERRRETLEALARNIAYKVRRTRRSVSLEPMNPYERRIIHSVLQQDNFVMTKSEGEEPYRHVVVFYRRNRNGEER